MSTVQTIIDRLFRTYLTPPDAQYAQVPLAVSIDAATDEAQLGSFTIAEDENLLRQGSLLELDQELVRVQSYDSLNRVATISRGQYGTEAQAHATPTLINVNPAYPAQSVFEAVRDNILQLYPKLYTVRSEALASVSGNVFPLSNPLIAQVLRVWPDQASVEVDIAAESVEFHPQAAGPAIVTKVDVGSIWVRYRSRMAVAESPEDKLVDLGMEDVWASIVMAGAAADLFAGRDLPKSHVDWVGAVLEAENIPVGTRTQLSTGLARYRELLISRFSKEMRGADSNKATVYINDPFSQVG